MDATQPTTRPQAPFRHHHSARHGAAHCGPQPKSDRRFFSMVATALKYIRTILFHGSNPWLTELHTLCNAEFQPSTFHYNHSEVADP